VSIAMVLEAEWVPFGRPALDRLVEVVTEAKAGDPLAPVTVIVPTNPVGVYARRALGSRPGGVANVDFTTVERLAHDLAGPALAAEGSTPLTDQIRAAAVRAELATSARSLEPVRHHASTDRAVADALATIHRAEASSTLANDGRLLVRDVVAIGRGVDERTVGHHDETDLASVAADHVSGSAPVVVFLPEWLFPAQRRLMAALAERVPVRLLLGATGTGELDAASVDLAGRLGVEVSPRAVHGVDPTEVRSVSDADDEARHAVRWLLARREEGVALHRMAVFYTAADPYRRALHRHLEAADVPSNGPSMVTVGETIVGRVVTRLLDLAQSDLRRDEVIGFVSSGPVRSPDGVTVRATIWDEQSRKAGVVRGLEQWTDRLAERSERLRARDDDPQSWSQREAEQCEELARFVATLGADLDARPERGRWRESVEWLKKVVARYLPGPSGRQHWPELEAEALERLLLTLDLLAGLDEIEPEPTWDSLRAAIDVELSRTTRRVGALGSGVLVGPLSSGIGAELDAVVIVGAVEGLAPRQVRHSVVLGRHQHETVGRDLGGDSLEAQHRRYLAALAASSGPRLVTWSRGEMRSGRRRYRSRWLDGVAAATDESVWPSFAAALTEPRDPAANVAEWDLRRLAPLDDITAHESELVASVPLLHVGGEAIAARRWGGLTPWSGRVDPAHVAGVLDGVLSATSLERFGSCSFRYFLSHVLRVAERDDPEDRVDIDPRDRGIAVHRILERLLRERLAAGVDVLPDDEERMASITEEVFDELERAGRTGHALRWELEQELIGEQLADFRQLDAQARAGGAKALAAELRFGMDDEAPPVEVDLGDRVLRFRGAADRVDDCGASTVGVVDYKTVSRAKKPEDVVEGLFRGQFLQLPLYARAAKERFGSTRATAAYWYLARSTKSTGASVDLDMVDPWFVEALDVYSSTISVGLFPTIPGDATTWPRHTFESCQWCDYDAICPVDRDELAERQEAEPELETFVTLTTRVRADES
jgi:RecB family exonuclease